MTLSSWKGRTSAFGAWVITCVLAGACSAASRPSSGANEGSADDSEATSQPATETAEPGGAATPAPAGDAGLLLAAHNRYREAHCAPPLAWSADLAKSAQRWADTLAKKGCKLEHSQGNFGENLAAGTAGTIGPERATEIWYDENENYDFAHGGFSMQAGHFTQVVWKGSKNLGCGTTTCGDKQLWVCQYDPPGNMQNEFPANVVPTTCKK
jgi:uncharacterized protein YkwD